MIWCVFTTIIGLQGHDILSNLILYHILPIHEHFNYLMLMVHGVQLRPSKEVVLQILHTIFTAQCYDLYWSPNIDVNVIQKAFNFMHYTCKFNIFLMWNSPVKGSNRISRCVPKIMTLSTNAWICKFRLRKSVF